MQLLDYEALDYDFEKDTKQSFILVYSRLFLFTP